MAFDGDNLLGLTYKICEGNLPELPDRYGETDQYPTGIYLYRVPRAVHQWCSVVSRGSVAGNLSFGDNRAVGIPI